MMDDKMSREEQNLDKFINDMDKIDIPVPDELEFRIRDRVRGIKPGRNTFIKTASAFAALFLIFVLSLQVFPGFRAYAEGIPVIGEALKWLSGDIGREELNNIFKNAESVVIRPRDKQGETKVLSKDEIGLLDKACSDAQKVPGEVIYDVPSPEVIPFPDYTIDIKLKGTAVLIQWDSVKDGGGYFQVIPITGDPELKRYHVYQKSNNLWNALKALMPVEPERKSDELGYLSNSSSVKVVEGKGSKANLGEVPIGQNKMTQMIRLLEEASPTDEKVELKPLEEYPIVLEFTVDSSIKLVYIMENSFIYDGILYKSDLIQIVMTRTILDFPND